MTTIKQKKVLRLLLNGGIIAGNGWYRIIVFDKRRIPLMRIHKKTFDAVMPYCKKNNLGLGFVISIRAVQRQRKNSFVKKEYLLITKNKHHVRKTTNG
jgi:hypothetical protein